MPRVTAVHSLGRTSWPTGAPPAVRPLATNTPTRVLESCPSPCGTPPSTFQVRKAGYGAWCQMSMWRVRRATCRALRIFERHARSPGGPPEVSLTSITAPALPACSRNVRAATDLKARPRGLRCSETAIVHPQGMCHRPGGPASLRKPIGVGPLLRGGHASRSHVGGCCRTRPHPTRTRPFIAETTYGSVLRSVPLSIALRTTAGGVSPPRPSRLSS